MKGILSLLIGVTAGVLCAGTALESISVPEGNDTQKNLFSNPTLQPSDESAGSLAGWSNFGGKSIKVSWKNENGRKIFRAVSSTPGYHLGIFRSMKLKPATEYQFYIICRGKVTGKGSKVTLLYREGQVPGTKKAVFAASEKSFTKDFDWTLVSGKIKTPDVFPNGTCSFYIALLTGSVDLEVARAGLIEKGAADKPLAPVNPKYKNLLNNPSFTKGKDGWPYNWNQNFKDKAPLFRCESSADGKNVMVLLPRTQMPQSSTDPYDEVTLKQGEMTLVPKKRYRIGALVKITGLEAKRGGLILYNSAWAASCGIEPLPVATNGWKRIEKDVTLPNSRFELYTFAVYTVGCTKGEIRIKDPYVIPLDDEAAKGVKKAAPIHQIMAITPIDPLLDRIHADQPEMLFSFTSILPEPERNYVCRICYRMDGAAQFSAPKEFSLQNGRIKTRLAKTLKPGRGTLRAELIHKKTGKTVAKSEYPFTAIRPVKLSRQPKRLNMLTQRLLTAKGKDGSYVFSAPRDGWVFIHLTQGGKDTQFILDKKPVSAYYNGTSSETLRHVTEGDHQLQLKGTAGGELIVNSIPEIFAWSYPYLPYNTKYETFHPEFVEKYLMPHLTSFNHGYPINGLPRGTYEKSIARGQEWSAPGHHVYNPNKFETPDAMAKRFLAYIARTRNQYTSIAFDEISITDTEDKWVYTRAMRKLADADIPYYTWSSGVKFSGHSLDVEYLSSVFNNARGKGKFLFEFYIRTMPTEKEAEAYLNDMMNESLRRADAMIPGAARHSFMILGGYTNAGQYNTDYWAGPQVKKYWNMYFRKLATEPEFKDLYGVGLYCYYHGNEESIRWVTRLIRHYVLEGRTDDLAKRYGYVYLPGHLTNGDFTEGLKGWTAVPAEKDSIKTETIKGFGRTYQRRQGVPFSIGDTVCSIKRSAKAPNRLSFKMTGLTPGKLYIVRYAVVDRADVKAKKPSKKKHLLKVQFDGAENITGQMPLGKYVGKDGIWVINYVNNAAAVFKPAKSTVTLTFTDWQDAKTAGAPAGQELLLNFVRVQPYYAE